ncbi:MAG: hypothetical protein ACRDE2_07840 [Chitinophagaceae bacterium]
METLLTDWKQELKLLHLKHLERNNPNAFRLSGGYSQKVKPYKDNNTGGLIKCITDFIRFQDGNTEIKQGKGKVRIINGKLKWVNSIEKKKIFLINATLNNKNFTIEVSPQKGKGNGYRNGKGINKITEQYFVVESMNEFISIYNKYFRK